MNRKDFERQLDAFDPAARRLALTQLLQLGLRPASVGVNVNLHFHSFFSYNACGYSPTHIAWEAFQRGLYAAGLCDFDVLDGQEEFLEAGLVLGLRTAVHLETRAFLQDYADAEMNSPSEPGVAYIMGAGFARPLPPDTPQAATLARYREQAAHRNRALVARINPHVPRIALDYDQDVVPLSPGQCPTERHIIRAYANRAAGLFPDRAARIGFWSELLGRPAAEVEGFADNPPALEERIRARFVKKGGFGYEQPTAATFPAVEDFAKWVLACDAIPMLAWLDGTFNGEANPQALLDNMRAKGVAAVNIIPDRNWNIADSAVKAVKTAKLREFVSVCERLQLPINIGTEMNRDGLPFTDNLDEADLKPYQEAFMRGAQTMIGQTILLRYAGYSYVGRGAAQDFNANVAAKNRFFAAVGALPPLTTISAERLRQAGQEKALAIIRDSVKRGVWSG